MFCPKCKDIFEEGSRRFCPTDGSRLISETGVPQREPGSIFASLIPKIQAAGDRDETLLVKNQPPPVRQAAPPLPRPLQQPIPQPTRPPEVADTPFFELDDPEFDPVPVFPKPEGQPHSIFVSVNDAETRPIARKVQPFEIPAGHVDLHAENRFPSPAEDFSVDNPERFVGRTVKGRYRILEFLGGDESGLAYLGDDKIVDDRKVLVRILLGESDDEIMQSVMAEERVSLLHFSHPNVARMIDSGEFSNGLNFIVSEYVDSLSVADILTIHGKFNPQRAGRIIRQASSALNEAHQEGIIHRDIRPENLIVDATADMEIVKVVNFGASSGDPNDRNVGYKAAEVLQGKIATAASDTHSLAVVAFEMLTGELPFTARDEKALLKAQDFGLTRLPSSINADLPRSVDEVFDRGLAFDPADRFPKARDFGDALVLALADPVERPIHAPIPEPPAVVPTPTIEASEQPTVLRKGPVISLEPVVVPTPAAELTGSGKEEISWRNRSPEPPVLLSSSNSLFAVVGVLAILAVAGLVWYFATANQTTIDNTNQAIANQNLAVPGGTEMPPPPRTISQPPNTTIYQNNKSDLKGDLTRNFLGFSLFYPNDWKLNGPQAGANPNSRGKFLDISELTTDGRMKEQMLIGYYPSKGTFDLDGERFPQMVKETNDTLKKLLPGYQMISEGETKLNQNWRAYEVKFQAGGTSDKGEKLVLWGRRLFVPAARPGARSGYEITMLATSLADGLTSVDDVGVKGKLSSVLETFEPSQNF